MRRAVKQYCPNCKSDMPDNMICEDYMSGCYCMSCGEDLDDKPLISKKSFVKEVKKYV